MSEFWNDYRIHMLDQRHTAEPSVESFYAGAASAITIIQKCLSPEEEKAFGSKEMIQKLLMDVDRFHMKGKI